MSITKILVPVTGTARDKGALEAAFAAAKPFQAHVAALYVHPDPRFALPYMGTPVSPDVVQDIVNAAMEMSHAAAKSAREAFEDAARKAGVAILPAPRKSATASGSFQEREGFFPQGVADAARLSDLVVFGPLEPADGPDLSDAFIAILMDTSRPVLLARHAPNALQHVAIAWDGGAASCRAVLGAKPFLVKADKITILACHPDQASKERLRDLEDYLALNGKSATVATLDASHAGIGATLLEASRNMAVDLLVMGGYGHSHLGETLFGGVTHYVRWHAQIPVLMVH